MEITLNDAVVLDSFLSAKVKSCCSEGGSPSSVGRKALEFRTKELDGPSALTKKDSIERSAPRMLNEGQAGRGVQRQEERPEANRESDSFIVARGKTPVWKQVKWRTSYEARTGNQMS